MHDLLTKIEDAIDAHPSLTRSRYGMDYRDEAEIVIGRHTCRAQIRARHGLAKGRAARHMTEIWGEGPTPEAAVDSLIERLPHWTQALS